MQIWWRKLQSFISATLTKYLRQYFLSNTVLIHLCANSGIFASVSNSHCVNQNAAFNLITGSTSAHFCICAIIYAIHFCIIPLTSFYYWYSTSNDFQPFQRPSSPKLLMDYVCTKSKSISSILDLTFRLNSDWAVGVAPRVVPTAVSTVTPTVASTGLRHRCVELLLTKNSNMSTVASSLLGEPPLYDYYYMPCYISVSIIAITVYLLLIAVLHIGEHFNILVKLV